MYSISDSTSDPPGEYCWLVRNGIVLASLEVPQTRRGRRRGLLGRDGLDGAMLIDPARSVHTIGMRFAIDVAVLDGDGIVLKTMTMKPHRMSMPVRGGRAVLEAEAGTFRTWSLVVGDELEIRHVDDARP